MQIGIVSDTHGLVRPEALAALQGVDVVLHAGDVGKPEVLTALADIAPVHAVRGNVDRGAWASELPASLRLEFGGVRFFVTHERASVDTATASTSDVVVTGHSHRPRLEVVDGVTYLNPGSIGPRRFTLPVALARGCVTEGRFEVDLVVLRRFDE